MAVNDRNSVTVADSPTAQGPTLVGTHASMGQLQTMIELVARRGCTVLIQGESGTGKELVARSIHAHSPRANEPLIPVDCTTLHSTLFESQLFGHVRGAFTDAAHEATGFIRSAHGGTLFLDEVGELDSAGQSKLLRFLQEGTVTPLGSADPIKVDVRVLAATHRDLSAMVERGEFRLDLYYRLHVISLQVPPLRNRREDVVPLAEHLLAQLSELYEEPSKSLSSDARRLLMAATWRGNVRELRNAVEHAFVFCQGSQIGPEHLPVHLQTGAAPTPDRSAPSSGVVSLDSAQRDLVTRALEATDGHQTRAAELLQVDRRRLYRMVARYDLHQMTR